MLSADAPTEACWQTSLPSHTENVMLPRKGHYLCQQGFVAGQAWQDGEGVRKAPLYHRLPQHRHRLRLHDHALSRLYLSTNDLYVHVYIRLLISKHRLFFALYHRLYQHSLIANEAWQCCWSSPSELLFVEELLSSPRVTKRLAELRPKLQTSAHRLLLQPRGSGRIAQASQALQQKPHILHAVNKPPLPYSFRRHCNRVAVLVRTVGQARGTGHTVAVPVDTNLRVLHLLCEFRVKVSLLSMILRSFNQGVCFTS